MLGALPPFVAVAGGNFVGRWRKRLPPPSPSGFSIQDICVRAGGLEQDERQQNKEGDGGAKDSGGLHTKCAIWLDVMFSQPVQGTADTKRHVPREKHWMITVYGALSRAADRSTTVAQQGRGESFMFESTQTTSCLPRTSIGLVGRRFRDLLARPAHTFSVIGRLRHLY